MSQVVGAYQVPIFTSPVDGQTQSAAVVLGNDNTNRVGHNNHDSDPGVHFQSSTLATRPAAGTAGRKWFTTDTRRIYFDTGSAWEEAAYRASADDIPLATDVSGVLAVANGGTGNSTEPTDGQMLIGDTGVGFVLGTITGSGRASVSVGAGTVNVAVTAIGGSGTAGKIPKFADSDDLADSIMSEDALGISLAGAGASLVVSLGFSGAAKTIDWSDGNGQYIEMNANCVFTFSNPIAGGWYTLFLVNDGTLRTPTWPGSVRWSGGSAPVLTGTNGKVDTVSFFYNGTSYLGYVVGKNA